MRWSKSLIGMGLSLAQRPQQINCSHNCNSFQLANSDSESKSATVLAPRPSWPLWHWLWHWQTRLCPPRLRGAAGLDACLPAAQADVQAARQLPVGAHLLLVQCRHLLPAAVPSCLRGSSSSYSSPCCVARRLQSAVAVDLHSWANR